MQKKYNHKIYSIVSLFSGGGFLDLGFMNQGFQIQEAIEIEPHFIKAYNSAINNHISVLKKHRSKAMSIQHIDIVGPVDATDKKEQKRIAKKHQNINGIIGGPPCQDYSVGGSNAGVTGKRGKLINTYLEIVELTKPQFLFFENVEGLYKTKEHQKAFLRFVTKLKKLDYIIWHDVINVLNYGYPQDRPRVALVGFKKEIVSKLVKNGYLLEIDNSKLRKGDNESCVFKWPKQKFENPKAIEWPKQWEFKHKNGSNPLPIKYHRLQVINAFKGLTNSTPNQKDRFKPKSKRFETVGEGDTGRKSFKRLHRYRYSPTVAYGNNEVHLHPTKARRLSVREALRLQTVPDSYVLPDDIPLTYKFKLISNGVPVAKAELIAKEIKRTLTLYNKLNTNGHLVKAKKKPGDEQNTLRKHKARKAS